MSKPKPEDGSAAAAAAAEKKKLATTLRDERTGLCRAIRLLQQVNRDVRKTSMDMASQRNLLRLKKTISQLAYHSLADVPRHAMRLNDELLCELGHRGIKTKMQCVVINAALLFFRFVETAFVVPQNQVGTGKCR